MHGSHGGAHAQPAAPARPGAARTLNRDYKHVVQHSLPAAQVPAWVTFLAGLGVGLAVAAAVWMHYRDLPPPEPQATADTSPASSTAPDDVAAETPETVASATSAPAADSADLTFYATLPDMEVEVPPESTQSTAAPRHELILQAGAFKNPDEAEKLQARLQLHGVESRIQRFTLDDENWYRVRIGPIATAEEQAHIQQKLGEADVEAQPVVADADVPPP